MPGSKEEDLKRNNSFSLFDLYGHVLAKVKKKVKHPNTSMFAFRNVSRLSVEQTNLIFAESFRTKSVLPE